MQKIRINKKYLDSNQNGYLWLYRKPERVAHVTENDKNPELILAYNGKLPTEKTERDLYEIPHKENPIGSEEKHLEFNDATVILITLSEDNKFRKNNQDTIDQLENFMIE